MKEKLEALKDKVTDVVEFVKANKVVILVVLVVGFVVGSFLAK